MPGVMQLWRHRALAEVLVARELKARYRGTALGFCWSFVNPLLLMSIYVLVFRIYMRIDVPNYPAFLLTGLLPWTAFSGGVSEGMGAVIHNGSIVRKVRLPAEVFPFVAVAGHLLHFVFSLPVLVAILVQGGLAPRAPFLLLPLLLAAQFLFAYGVALVLASLAVQFRDLTHIVPNLMMIWFYLTPVFYPPDMVPERLRPLALINPLTWIIGAYRDICFHGRVPQGPWLPAFAALALALALVGTALFQRRAEMYPELV